MSTEPTQSFANHARLVPGFHYVLSPLTLIFLVWSLTRLASQRSADALYGVVGAVAMMGNLWFTRGFPLKAQDRVIRLEEELRLARLLPDDLRRRAHELTPRQLISLRFASDAELPEMVRWVLTERVTDSKAIKQRIRDWRPDHFRV